MPLNSLVTQPLGLLVLCQTVGTAFYKGVGGKGTGAGERDVLSSGLCGLHAAS